MDVVFSFRVLGAPIGLSFDQPECATSNHRNVHILRIS